MFDDFTRHDAHEEKCEAHAKALATIIDDMGVEWVLQQIGSHVERVIEGYNISRGEARKLRDTCAKLIGTWTYQ
jgi:hypothetical protein